MEETKNKNGKKIVISGIVFVVVISLALCFYIAYNNITIPTFCTS